MAPEQAQGEACEARTDLYSLGVMMYRLLTGHLPFYGATPTETLAQHVLRVPTPPSVLVPDIDIPPALEAVVLKALAKRPEQRWGTAKAMRDALLELLGDPEESTQVREPRRSTASHLSRDHATTAWSIHAFEWRDRMLRRRRFAATLSGASLGLCAFMFFSLFPMPGVATLAGGASLSTDEQRPRGPRPPPPASLGPKPTPRTPAPAAVAITVAPPQTDDKDPDIVLIPDTALTPVTPRRPRPPFPPPNPRRAIEKFLKRSHQAFRKCSETLPLGEKVVIHIDLSLEPSTGRLLNAEVEESRRTRDYAICAKTVLRGLKYPVIVGDGQLKGLELAL